MLVRWNDNNIVRVCSNINGEYPFVKAKRWFHKDKKNVEIDQPNVIAQYNQYMGGTDPE